MRKLSNGVGIATQDFLFPAITFHFQLKIVASLLPALCFIGVSFAGCDRNLAMALMTLGTTLMAGMYCGFYSNHIDIASNYAGTLMAICNTSDSSVTVQDQSELGAITNGHFRCAFLHWIRSNGKKIARIFGSPCVPMVRADLELVRTILTDG